MNIVLLQSPLSVQEIEQLINEFPHFLFLVFTSNTYKNLSKEDWGKVEVIFGNRLTDYELSLAHQLRWIHSPSDQLNRLCLEAIKAQGNVQITVANEQNLTQIGEFVFGTILAFAKNLFKWRELDRTPVDVWDSQLRDKMWMLNGKRFLQIGMGNVGGELARMAKQFGMGVWGVQARPSFNPFCQKTFGFEALHKLLPEADVVSISLPRSPLFEEWFGEEEFNLMKEDSILAVVGHHKIFSKEALVQMKAQSKLRGLLVDASYQTPVPQGSLLWEIPQAIITPEVGSRPKSKSTQAFQAFRYNMRQYIHGNLSVMRNCLNQTTMMFEN